MISRKTIQWFLNGFAVLIKISSCSGKFFHCQFILTSLSFITDIIHKFFGNVDSETTDLGINNISGDFWIFLMPISKLSSYRIIGNYCIGFRKKNEPLRLGTAALLRVTDR